MSEAVVREDAEQTIAASQGLLARGEVRAAIDLLTNANLAGRDAALERALVQVRADGCAASPPPRAAHQPPVVADPAGGELFEIDAAELTASALRTGFARSGCTLVRGLLPADRAHQMADGIDRALDAYDASVAGEAFDSDWYHPFDMPSVISPVAAGAAVTIPEGSPTAKHIPGPAHRRVVRQGGGLWTVDSPRMLFEWLLLLDDVGLGAVMASLLGERPFLSANKCTLRKVEPADEITGGWHQDGAFLGEEAGAFNVWVALSPCGRDAPGLDIVPRRFDHVLTSGEDAYFKWSLSEASVLAAADGATIVRPAFEAGDALLFDHQLLHRTGTSLEMTRDRHAIESWFFAPGAFPASQLPLVY